MIIKQLILIKSSGKLLNWKTIKFQFDGRNNFFVKLAYSLFKKSRQPTSTTQFYSDIFKAKNVYCNTFLILAATIKFNYQQFYEGNFGKKGGYKNNYINNG